MGLVLKDLIIYSEKYDMYLNNYIARLKAQTRALVILVHIHMQNVIHYYF